MAIPLAGAAQLGQIITGLKTAVDEIQRLPDAVKGFVAAFNPAAVERLDYAHKSLAATIGFALEPIILTATRVVERFADAISGGMERLRGPIERVSGLFLGALAPAFETVRMIFDGLADAGEALMPVMEGLAPVMESALAFGHVLAALGIEATLATIKGLVGEGKTLADVTANLIERFMVLSEGALVLSHHFLKMVGQEAILVDALKRLSQEAQPGGRRAPAFANFQMQGLESIYQQRLLAAAKGGGKDVAEQSRDYLADIRELARKMLERLEKDEGGVAEQGQRVQNQAIGLIAAGMFGAGPGGQAAVQALANHLEQLLRQRFRNNR